MIPNWSSVPASPTGCHSEEMLHLFLAYFGSVFGFLCLFGNYLSILGSAGIGGIILEQSVIHERGIVDVFK